jgi:hypothetical protein
VQMGLTRSEIDRLGRQVKKILDQVDKGRITTG